MQICGSQHSLNFILEIPTAISSQCVNCDVTNVCISVLGHIGTWITIPEPENECAEVTQDQLYEGEYDAYGDGHFSFGHMGARSNNILDGKTSEALLCATLLDISSQHVLSASLHVSGCRCRPLK